VAGLFGRYIVDEASKTKVTASLAYGSYDYDANRRSYGGAAVANGISSDAFEFALGVSTVSFEKDGFRVIPNASVRFMTGSVDSFTESGSGVNLAVDKQDLDSLLLDLGVDFEYQAQENLLFVGHIGYVTDFEDSDNTVSARFAASGPLASPFSVQAPGIDDEGFILGLGAYYDINQTIRVGLTYRGEFRLNSQSSQSIGIGASFGF
jgi:outer membrane autotransporter protein